MDEFCGFDQILHCVKVIVEVMFVIKFVRDFLCNRDNEFKQMIEASFFTWLYFMLSNLDLKRFDFAVNPHSYATIISYGKSTLTFS
jgi:hypothetical protein